MKNLSAKNYIFGAVRWVAVIAFVVVLILFASQNKISKAPLKDVSAATVKAVNVKKMQKGNDSTFKRLYGLNSADYDGVFLYWPLSNMDAEEMLIVKLKDVSQQEQVKEAIAAR